MTSDSIVVLQNPLNHWHLRRYCADKVCYTLREMQEGVEKFTFSIVDRILSIR